MSIHGLGVRGDHDSFMNLFFFSKWDWVQYLTAQCFMFRLAKKMKRKERSRKRTPTPSTASKWLCAHPPAKKITNLSESESPTSIIPQLERGAESKPEPLKLETLGVPYLDAVDNDGPDEETLSPGVYHPKKSYLQGYFKRSNRKVLQEIQLEESISLPSTIVFTEDILYSNYDWGVGNTSVNSPPQTLIFSDEI